VAAAPTDYRERQIAKVYRRRLQREAVSDRVLCHGTNHATHRQWSGRLARELRSGDGAFGTARCNSTTKHQRLWRRLRRDCASSA